jgi:hypothetical protein
MDVGQRPYFSYLLRLWLVEGDGPVWRASLENPSTTERHGFTTLEQLIAFLVAETRELAAEEGWRLEEGNPGGRAPRRKPVGG